MRDAHRKARLAHLIKTDYSSRQDFLSKNDWCSKARLSQALGESQPFAEDAAALWEQRLGLQAGWFNSDAPTPKEARQRPAPAQANAGGLQLSWPFSAELHRAVAVLNEVDKAYAENALRNFLRMPQVAIPSGGASVHSKRDEKTGTDG